MSGPGLPQAGSRTTDAGPADGKCLAVLGGDDGEEVVDGASADFSEHLFAFVGRFGKIAHVSLGLLGY